MTEPQNPVPVTARLKEGIAALKEGVIVVAVVILLVQPRCIGEIAKEAGLKSAFGMEFFDQLQKSQEESDKAQAALDAITDELARFKRQLQTLSQSTGPTTNPVILSGEIRKLARNADSLERKSTAVTTSLRTNLQFQKDLLRRARSRQ